MVKNRVILCCKPNDHLTHFFFELNALASKTFRFLLLAMHGVRSVISHSNVSSKFSDDPIAPTIFRIPLNTPITQK